MIFPSRPVTCALPLALVALLLGATLAGCSANTPSEPPTAVPVVLDSEPVADDVVEREGSIALGIRPLRDSAETTGEALERSEAAAGRQADVVRLDYDWDEPFPDRSAARVAEQGKTLHLNIQTRRADGTPVSWSETASAAGGPLWAERQQWVNAITGFSGTLDVTIASAPSDDAGMGTPDDFVALWRRLAADLQAQNPDVSMTWVIGSDEADSDAWYPGDDVVDKIGAEVANTFGCRGDDQAWIGPQQLLSPLLVLGERHPGKELIVASIGTVEDPETEGRKAGWLEELAFALEGAGLQQVAAVTFADGRSPNDPGCDWSLDSSEASEDAFGTVATLEHLGGATAAPATVRCPARGLVPALGDDFAVADTNGDGMADLTFGESDRSVGVGEHGAEGRDQRIVFRFPAVKVDLGSSERVELRVRLLEPGPVGVGGVRLVGLLDESTSNELAFAAPAQILDEQLLGDGSLPGWYEIDVTARVLLRDASMFRLEVSEPPQTNGLLSMWTVAMADAIDPADRPTLVVRGC